MKKCLLGKVIAESFKSCYKIYRKFTREDLRRQQEGVKVMVQASKLRGLIFLVIFCLGGWAANGKPSDAAQSLFHSFAKPAPPPDFAVEDLNGKPVNFKDRTGDVILVNFWATW